MRLSDEMRDVLSKDINDSIKKLKSIKKHLGKHSRSRIKNDALSVSENLERFALWMIYM